MRYFVSIDHCEHSVDVVTTEHGVGVLEGEQTRAAHVVGDHGVYRVLLGERVNDLSIRRLGPPDSQGLIQLEVQYLGGIRQCQISSLRDRAPKPERSILTAQARTLVAQMPGKVLHVRVCAGDEVAEGQGLLVLEAMKMENELYAEANLKVVDVLIKAGDTVEAGAPLLIVV